ncbi:LCP family protein [Oceanirhabdus seepicola]|uniref:Regulatory protein MsrR n=1 Tax=Oceanirhabdus seepicola TaxID=2828781 RepID=A0A9J6P461_9CLOT|nr:LCP family protein [Oceanirhabdus seepicola]MCM1990360.1 LCP family protein [Oceanirhabdus seepicola]
MKKGKVAVISGIGILIVVMVIILGAYFHVMNRYNEKSFINNNVTKSEDKNKEESISDVEEKKNSTTNSKTDDNVQEKKEVIKYKEVEGITNILLVGTDEREDEKRTRSDTMMILTIDNINSKVKITSILRDTYAKIPGYQMQKLNHSYRYGGIDLLRQSLQKTFEMNIDYYAIVNFYGFKDIVDEIGGLELTVSEEEKNELNRCIIGLENQKENFFDEEPTLLEMTGTQHMNGQQVLAYSRMRKIGRGSFDRVERQREVVTKLLLELKETSIIKYPFVADKIFESVKTNIPFNTALDMAYTILKNNVNSINQLQVPPDKLCRGVNEYKDNGFVFIMDEENVKKVIHDFVFENIEYNPDEFYWFDYENSIYYVEPKPKIEGTETEGTETEGTETEGTETEGTKTEGTETEGTETEETETEGIETEETKTEGNKSKEDSEDTKSEKAKSEQVKSEEKEIDSEVSELDEFETEEVKSDESETQDAEIEKEKSQDEVIDNQNDS